MAQRRTHHFLLLWSVLVLAAPPASGQAPDNCWWSHDFDDDQAITLVDFFLFADHFGSTSDQLDWDPRFDVVPDQRIDLSDFISFMDWWPRGWTYEVGVCGDSLTTSLADSLHLFLDGDGDYLVIPRHSDLYGNAQQTIEARFRLDHFSDSNSFGWSQLLSNDEYELAIRASDRKLVACCYNAPSTLTSSTEIETGRWYDVAFVRDGSHQRLLLDGIVVASGSTHIVEPSLDLWIGNDPSPPNRPFGGAIDEVRIWRRALTDGEIAANIDRGQVEPSVDLVGYWDFDGSQAAGMVRDRSGNGHHGVLVGDAHLEAEGSEPSPPPTTSSS